MSASKDKKNAKYTNITTITQKKCPHKSTDIFCCYSL